MSSTSNQMMCLQEKTGSRARNHEIVVTRAALHPALLAQYSVLLCTVDTPWSESITRSPNCMVRKLFMVGFFYKSKSQWVFYFSVKDQSLIRKDGYIPMLSVCPSDWIITIYSNSSQDSLEQWSKVLRPGHLVLFNILPFSVFFQWTLLLEFVLPCCFLICLSNQY